MATKRARRVWLALGGIAVAVLAAAVFTLGSLKPFARPEHSSAFFAFFALSTFIVVAFLVFGLVLGRSIVRAFSERRAGLLGSRFKSQMLAGAMGISLLPLVFLFFFSYALVNRTLNLWFPRPLEIAQEEGQSLLTEWESSQSARLQALAERAAQVSPDFAAAARNLRGAADGVWLLDGSGVVREGIECPAGGASSCAEMSPSGPKPHLLQKSPNREEIWKAGPHLYLTIRVPFLQGALMAGQILPRDFLARVNNMEQQDQIYAQQREQLRLYKRQILLTLFLITVLLLSTTIWVALFLSKQVTVPIQAMAEATQQLARGNFDYRVSVQAHDELGKLVASFNQMTAQLGDSRRQIEEFARNLEQAVEERERRRQLMEAILENIPTGVISLSRDGEVSQINAAAVAILGESAREARSLSELASEEALGEMQHLIRRALRLGVASRVMEIPTRAKIVHAAVTISALGTRRENPGYVLVIDDLTELLRAQKAAAWQEVAQRIAHEIKNPLTPIQLSAQRLLRHIARTADAGDSAPEPDSAHLRELVAECAPLIEQEVSILASLVDEFSQFVRFPSARLAPSDANAIVRSAIEVFHGRLEGIALRVNLAPGLPGVRADSELLRRVVVNLIDNAAEALEDAPARQIEIQTRLDHRREAVEIEVTDSGPGISPEGKDRLFLPHFSTKERGTGLGLAIASRIVAEHNGTLRVEDNFPNGARFVIRLPAAEAPVPVSAGPAARAEDA